MRPMCGSKMPSVEGSVYMIAATVSSRFAARKSMSALPLASEGTVTTWKPAIAAVAGFVPCAESGTSTFVRAVSPRARW